jgi:large-conductance mechanosensitive channel
MLPLAIPVAEIVIGAAVGAIVASLTPERIDIDINVKFKD